MSYGVDETNLMIPVISACTGCLPISIDNISASPISLRILITLDLVLVFHGGFQ